MLYAEDIQLLEEVHAALQTIIDKWFGVNVLEK